MSEVNPFDDIESSAAMRFLMEDVSDFHKAMGVDPDPEEPGIPTADKLKLRAKLILEEVFETLNAMYGAETFDAAHRGVLEVLDQAHEDHGSSRCDLVGMADGLADSIYVEVGAALSTGIRLDRVWAEVQKSNMSKQGGVRREDGKVGKGPNFKPPRIREALYGEDEAGESAAE